MIDETDRGNSGWQSQQLHSNWTIKLMDIVRASIPRWTFSHKRTCHASQLKIQYHLADTQEECCISYCKMYWLAESSTRLKETRNPEMKLLIKMLRMENIYYLNNRNPKNKAFWKDVKHLNKQQFSFPTQCFCRLLLSLYMNMLFFNTFALCPNAPMSPLSQEAKDVALQKNYSRF